METLLGGPEAAVGQATAVLVRLGGARYAVDLAAIAEVVPVPATTRVPGTPSWLVGLANWRGRVLAVVDLRPLVGAPPTPLASSARLVVLALDDVEAGLVVESVSGLLEGGVHEAVGVPATVAPAAAALLRGVVEDDAGPVAQLDAAAVLALRRQLRPAARSTGPVG